MSLVRQFTSVGGATLLSRLLGFVRETMIAGALGAGPVADAFYAAFRFPNLFRRLFAEGAFNSAFVPLFARTLEGDGEAEAKRFAEDVLAILVLVLAGLTAIVMIATPVIVTLIAPGFRDNPDKFSLTVELFRVMFPYLICMSLTAMLSGVLNAYRRFFVAALAPVLLNVVTIAALAGAIFLGMEAEAVGRLLGWSVLAAGVAQLLMVAVAARRIGFSARFKRPRLTPGVKRLLWLAMPAAAAGGITQINLFVGQIIASTKEGAIAVLQYADRIYQLPLGVVGIAIGVVLLPELSRTLRAGHLREATHTQNRALEFALFLTLPAATALAIMPGPIVSVLFERGAFSPEAAAATSRALAIFALGLPAFVMIKVFMPGYFAREDTRTPLLFSAVSVAVNVALALSLFPRMAEAGIATAETVAGWTTAVLLATVLRRRGHWTVDATVLRRVPMIALCCAALGATLYGGLQLVDGAMAPGHAFVIRFGALLGLLAAAGIVYFAAAALTGAADMGALRRSLRRRPPEEPPPAA